MIERFEYWLSKVRKSTGAHATLKARAAARRLEIAMRLLANAIDDLSPEATLELVQSVLERLAPLRSIDLQDDYFVELRRSSFLADDSEDEEEEEDDDSDEEDDDGEDADEEGEGEEAEAGALEAEAIDEYSFLLEDQRDHMAATLRKKLKNLDDTELRRFHTRLVEELGIAERPSRPEACAIVEEIELRAFETLRPVLIGFDESHLTPSRIACRELRYAIKTLRPCFARSQYELNHVHAHRVQTLLGRVDDIERWVEEARAFPRSSAGKAAEIDRDVWEQVLRAALAQRMNLLHQLAHLPLVKSWLARAGVRADMLRLFRPDLEEDVS